MRVCACVRPCVCGCWGGGGCARACVSVHVARHTVYHTLTTHRNLCDKKRATRNVICRFKNTIKTSWLDSILSVMSVFALVCGICVCVCVLQIIPNCENYFSTPGSGIQRIQKVYNYLCDRTVSHFQNKSDDRCFRNMLCLLPFADSVRSGSFRFIAFNFM